MGDRTVRKLKDKEGSALYKRVTVTIHFGDHGPRKKSTRVYIAPAGKGFNQSGIDQILERVGEYLERDFGALEFRLLELQPHHFNFICEGPKKAAEVAA
jgi:hypothetical protein